jgi:hypothetical protein
VTVTKRKFENRLSKMITLPGGKTVEEATQDAESNMESIRDKVLTAMDKKVQRLLDSAAAITVDPNPEVLTDCYNVANEIFSLAGAFGKEQMGEAAYSLCELIDRSREAGKWSDPAFQAHMNALRLMRHDETEEGQEARKVVLEGLKSVVDAVTGPSSKPR